MFIYLHYYSLNTYSIYSFSFYIYTQADLNSLKTKDSNFEVQNYLSVGCGNMLSAFQIEHSSMKGIFVSSVLTSHAIFICFL